ncbi:hypothetical protein ACFCYF_24385 [Streptomyces chartreusis]|uniref:hypothetical protein n=1 Tax=Streptomyces chartreusis TaxID=1969 RepID=UPI0035E1E7BB
MLTMGDIRRTHLTAYGPDGITADTTTYDQDLFQNACTPNWPTSPTASVPDGPRTPPATTPAPLWPSPSRQSGPSPRVHPCTSAT